MPDMLVTQSLSEAWKDAVENRKIVNDFEAPSDDKQGRWSKGDRITFGIQLAGGGLTYFAENRTRSATIHAGTDERPVDGGGFVFVNSMNIVDCGQAGRSPSLGVKKRTSVLT